jgi:hypothetical protein
MKNLASARSAVCTDQSNRGGCHQNRLETRPHAQICVSLPKTRPRSSAFKDFGGGQIVADGIIKIEGKDTGVIIYRGNDPEIPKPHAASPEPPKPSPLPGQAAGSFNVGGGLAGIPLDQHFTISRGGIIMEGRAGTVDATNRKMVVQGAHAESKLHNRRWWGIEIEGNFRENPDAITPQQVDAVQRLCTWLSTLIEGFNPDENIKGHREVKPGNGTDCPGKLLDPKQQRSIAAKSLSNSLRHAL